MNKTEVVEQLRTLDSFAPWEHAYREVGRAEVQSPLRFDVNNREQLLGRVSLLDTRDAQIEARAGLILELAQQDENFLPLRYRLGLLVGLQVATPTQESIIRPLKDGMRGFSISRYRRPGGLMAGIDNSEIPVRAAEKPIERGMQIAHEVEKVQRKLDSKKAVPVCMVWNHKYSGDRLDRDDVVTGIIKKPKEAFVLQEPTFSEEGSPVFDIPVQLTGVTKGDYIWKPEYLEDDRRYKKPHITELSKLVSHSGLISPNALYIGKKDVDARIQRANRSMAIYTETLRVRSEYTRRARRRLGIRYR